MRKTPSPMMLRQSTLSVIWNEGFACGEIIDCSRNIVIHSPSASVLETAHLVVWKIRDNNCLDSDVFYRFCPRQSLHTA